MFCDCSLFTLLFFTLLYFVDWFVGRCGWCCGFCVSVFFVGYFWYLGAFVCFVYYLVAMLGCFVFVVTGLIIAW